MKYKLTILTIIVIFIVLACNLPIGVGVGEAVAAPTVGAQNPPENPSPAEIPDYVPGDKFSLWVDGPHLRGANIWQALVIPDLDGLEFKGPGPVGPPYSQEDFDHLASLGANYVAISGPGLFTEEPPFVVDQGAVENLDNLLAMIAKADMFATIGFRTGPGRSEYGLCCGGDWYFRDYFNDTMWEDQAAQDAWVEMWRYTADRYKDNPIVAGYKLMVEPNSNGAFFEIYDPDEFYAEYSGTLYDWNQLYPRLVDGIRQVDVDTPILIGGMGWSGVEWLPYMEPVDDPRTVYVVHQYEPQDDYTHQEPRGRNEYPGEMDLDYDNRDDDFDRAWMDEFLSPIDDFMAEHNVPVSVDEFGVNRWIPGGAQYMDDIMSLFEARGLNHALWEWQTSYAPFASDVNDMNFLLGPDPNNLNPADNQLKNVIVSYWSRNSLRPSSWSVGIESGSSASEGAQPSLSTAAEPAESDGDEWELWNNGTRLRGADLHPCWVDENGECVQDTTLQDILALRDLGANLINASYPGLFTEEAPYEVNTSAQEYLDNLVAWAEDVGIYVVIHFRTGPGRDEAAIHGERRALYDVWTDQAAHDGWISMWRYTAERFRNSPAVVGYNLMVEPHPNTLVDPDYDLEPEEVQAQLAGTLMDWNRLAAEITTAIREVDSQTPIIINSIGWGSADWFSILQPTDDPHTVYSLHAYDPDVYTHQEEGVYEYSYPDVVDDYGEIITFDRSWLEALYSPVREFATEYGVPIYVGEFGIMRWVPDGAAFLADQTALYEQYGWNYAYYTWRADSEGWDGFNLEIGPDPINHSPNADNPLLAVFKQRWSQNVDFPN